MREAASAAYNEDGRTSLIREWDDMNDAWIFQDGKFS